MGTYAANHFDSYPDCIHKAVPTSKQLVGNYIGVSSVA